MDKIKIENGIGIIPEGTTLIGQVRGLYGPYGNANLGNNSEPRKIKGRELLAGVEKLYRVHLLP